MAFPTTNRMFGANVADTVDGTFAAANEALLDPTDVISTYLITNAYSGSPDMDTDRGVPLAGEWEVADGVSAELPVALTGTPTVTHTGSIVRLNLDAGQTNLEWNGVAETEIGLLVVNMSLNAGSGYGIGVINFGADKIVSGRIRYFPDASYGLASLVY